MVQQHMKCDVSKDVSSTTTILFASSHYDLNRFDEHFFWRPSKKPRYPTKCMIFLCGMCQGMDQAIIQSTLGESRNNEKKHQRVAAVAMAVATIAAEVAFVAALLVALVRTSKYALALALPGVPVVLVVEIVVVSPCPFQIGSPTTRFLEINCQIGPCQVYRMETMFI